MFAARPGPRQPMPRGSSGSFLAERLVIGIQRRRAAQMHVQHLRTRAGSRRRVAIAISPAIDLPSYTGSVSIASSRAAMRIAAIVACVGQAVVGTGESADRSRCPRRRCRGAARSAPPSRARSSSPHARVIASFAAVSMPISASLAVLRREPDHHARLRRAGAGRRHHGVEEHRLRPPPAPRPHRRSAHSRDRRADDPTRRPGSHRVCRRRAAPVSRACSQVSFVSVE